MHIQFALPQNQIQVWTQLIRIDLVLLSSVKGP